MQAMNPTITQSALDELKKGIAGEIVVPESSGYDELRNVFNQMGSPAVIVRPQNSDDVVTAIRFARDNQLKLSVRSGGHGSTGLSTNVDGLVIDLAHFNAVEVIDAEKHLVRIGTGAKWGDAAKALSEHGLAISSGDTTSVGVGGLTLGGGIGWLVRKHGLTIDSVVGAEIVTADGRILHVSDDEHPDLFWALRGGGGNFGVVTAFEYRAQPLKSIVGGMVIYNIGETEAILTKGVDYMRGAPEELNATFTIFPGFGPQVPPGLMLFLCYGGEDEAAANAAIKPLLELGTIVHQDIKTKPYYQMLEDAAAPPGIRAANLNGFVKSLDKELIAVLAANYGKPGTPIVQIRMLGGAVSRVKPDATAFAHREYEAFILMAAMMPVATPQEQLNQQGHEAWKPIKPFTSGAYINFLSDVSAESVATAYPSATYARLVSVKAAYDPDNVFNQNLNIKPA